MDQEILREVAVKVSRYFRDFLETDFKRSQAPRRRIALRSDSGFRTGMRIRPYPGLDSELWSLLARPTLEPLTFKFAARRYTRSMSETLKRVVSEQISAIPASAVDAVREAVVDAAQRELATALDDPEAWIEAVTRQLCVKGGEHIVRPLIAQLDGAMKRSAYSMIDSMYAAEADLVTAVASPATSPLEQALARYLAQRDITVVTQALDAFLTHEGVISALNAFFQSFVTADAFLEFRDLDTFVGITEGVQLYLYLGSCTFGDAQYPLFFVPLEVERQPDGTAYRVTLVNQVFSNRAAIDFVLQELAQGHRREWASPIQERISYLAPEQSLLEVSQHLFRLVATSMDLGGDIDLRPEAPSASTTMVKLSAELFICAYERGEESLVNDYENLIELARTNGGAVFDLFTGLVGDMLTRNPVSIAAAVEESWDRLPLGERLVFDSPIPLNEEQRKILLALAHPQGRIIVVEGPPGTGKSHTITAIAADCAFNQRSCLILSDKLEALQVVQDKLSEAMSRVRHDPDVPNPLLRIGRQDANFKRLVANQTVNQVAAYARAEVRARPQLQAEHQATASRLRDDIEETARTLGALTIAQIEQFHRTEATLSARMPELVPLLHASIDAKAAPVLRDILRNAAPLQHYLGTLFKEGDYDLPRLWRRVRADEAAHEVARAVGAGAFEDWALFEHLGLEQLRTLMHLVLQYAQLKMPVIGYLFRGGAVRSLENLLNQLPVSRPLRFKTEGAALERLCRSVGRLRQALDSRQLLDEFEGCFDRLARAQLDHEGAAIALRAMNELQQVAGLMPTLLAREEDEADLWVLAMSYLADWLEVGQVFERAPQIDYVGTKSKLEQLTTSLMNTQVDTRLVDFIENNKADAKVLASLMQRRQKFPEDKFAAVRSSFPVIIASIREFGEYMPLAPELFDVVVIDEASQVSVAQALPAILRGKKVVVLGDSRQFSNVKSANASIATNERYRAELVQYFRRDARADAQALERLSLFDVKRSVLEFCSLAASYTIMLRKHFRSFPELIGYSSKTFYSGQLQALKVRGVPLSEVIRFDLVVSETGEKLARTSNAAEARFIETKLVELLDAATVRTVGVITPFRQQQELLTRRLCSHPRAAEFEDRLRLKIMTFDSCQGEERQVIFYSMVASEGQDALNYVFPVNLDNPQEDVEAKLKVQRLNVGFSRAQETIWFVHTQPLTAFRGAIGAALNHFAQVLVRKGDVAGTVAMDSPMEEKVLQWLEATRFVQLRADEVEIQPQFPIGEYLRQLDPTYAHPAWRVDFLMTVPTQTGPLRIVVEYDGFEYHFAQKSRVHSGNHERYLIPADIERQLTLEGYGYRFLRINRFNIGRDPVQMLDGRLNELCERSASEQTSEVIERVRSQAAGLAAKEMRACSRCKEIRPLAQFHDPTLRNGASGFGRVCMPCKRAS
jgi:hypothetical protein